MTTKCKGLIGLLFGHKFEPIITCGASTFGSSAVSCKAYVALQMADKYRAETFHGCICRRCGVRLGDVE